MIQHFPRKWVQSANGWHTEDFDDADHKRQRIVERWNRREISYQQLRELLHAEGLK